MRWMASSSDTCRPSKIDGMFVGRPPLMRGSVIVIERSVDTPPRSSRKNGRPSVVRPKDSPVSAGMRSCASSGGRKTGRLSLGCGSGATPPAMGAALDVKAVRAGMRPVGGGDTGATGCAGAGAALCWASLRGMRPAGIGAIWAAIGSACIEALTRRGIW